ncbi:tubulin domain-containing protein [Sarocladium implicatum]|nr:tubulin domain-containing protein [Sarocladium implicatum]
MREIVSLQLGNLSNYNATHFWNAQESYFTYASDDKAPVDHDVHWRPGVGADGSETFLPRTVVYDLKGGFGSLRKINALYDPEPESDPTSLWPGRQVVEKQKPLQPSEYQQSLDAGTAAPTLTTSSVRYWSDFSRVFYHPRSLVQLYDYELDSSIRPFDRFAAGSDLFQSLDKDDDILDRDFRPFVEECDRMQGIQVWAGLDDAWGGFAGEYVERLRDEYGKTCVWVWGSQAPTAGVQREKRRLRMANTAQSLNRLCASASMVVPMSLPTGKLADGVKLDASSSWHLSALLSAGLESATLPLRLTGQSGQHAPSMDDMTEFLNTGGNQTVARLRMGVGRRLQAAEPGEDDETDVIDLFGMGETGVKRKSSSRKFGQVTMDRGLGDAEVEELEDERQKPTRPVPGNPVIRKFQSSLAFPLLDSYPSIYSEGVTEAGLGLSTVLSTDTAMRGSLRGLREQTAWLLPMEERETLTNGLDEIADAYQDDWSSGSDDDDDD